MAASLQITDSITTVTLNSTNMKLLSYVPQSSSTDITESAEVFFMTGSTYERSDTQSLNRLFEQARSYQRIRIGSRVFVEYKPSSSDAAFYRSEIKNGSITIGHAQRASIVWTRVPFWEGPETAIPLTNGSATETTGGLTVYNHDDAGHDNWAHILAKDVIGDLPAPPRLEITNNYNSADRANRVYVAHNVQSNVSTSINTFEHILEGEAGTGGTETDDANSSSAHYQLIKWTATTETDILDWDLSTDLLTGCAGNYFRFLLRQYAAVAYTDLWLKLKVKLETTTIWQSEWVLVPASRSLIEIATLQLPPALVGVGDVYPAHLVLSAKRNAAGEHSLGVDYGQLSAMDGWRNLQNFGYNLGYEARLVDDMIDNYLYTDGWSDDGKFGNYYTASAPILLVPNKDQRLYFLHDTSASGTAPIARTLSIKAIYRPRRNSL